MPKAASFALGPISVIATCKVSSVVSPSPVTLAEAYEAFLSILEANGMTVIPHGRFLKIVDSGGIVNPSTPGYSGGEPVPVVPVRLVLTSRGVRYVVGGAGHRGLKPLRRVPARSAAACPTPRRAP